jgi:hypothetical protein
MFLTFEDRPSDSPFIERVWRAHSAGGGVFLSIAEGNLELVVTRLPGLTRVTLRGPVTTPSMVDCPPNGQWIAVRFRLGTYLPRLPTALLMNHNSLDLPLTADDRFWFEGAAWEIPAFENAEVFVQRLARSGAIARDPAVGATILGDRQALTLRSVQRHFLRATGMTRNQVRQIERARFAVDLLRNGSSVLDVVHDAGYFDQAHLTRSLRQLTGQTPVKILRQEVQLSFLYKTAPTGDGYDRAVQG